MVRRLHALAAVAECAISFGASSALAGVTIHDFASASGESTPASIGIASFSSPATYTFGPNGMVFADLGSTVLGDTTTVTAEPLIISFATPQNLVSFDFGLIDFLDGNGDDVLDVALDNGTPVQFGTAIPGTDFFPQGTVSLSSNTPFTSVEITADNPLNTIVIADLVSTQELASMAEMGAVRAGLLAVRRRRV